MSSNADNRRRSERFPAELSVKVDIVADDGPGQGTSVISDLSRSGIFVTTPTRAALGQTVYFRFRGPEGECVALGNVICNRESRGFAVQFLGETEEMAKFFDFAEALPERARLSLLNDLGDARVEIV